MNVESALRYAAEIEGHADNVAAALMGGLVVTSVRPDGSVIVIRNKVATGNSHCRCFA